MTALSAALRRLRARAAGAARRGDSWLDSVDRQDEDSPKLEWLDSVERQDADSPKLEWLERVERQDVDSPKRRRR